MVVGYHHFRKPPYGKIRTSKDTFWETVGSCSGISDLDRGRVYRSWTRTCGGVTMSGSAQEWHCLEGQSIVCVFIGAVSFPCGTWCKMDKPMKSQPFLQLKQKQNISKCSCFLRFFWGLDGYSQIHMSSPRSYSSCRGQRPGAGSAMVIPWGATRLLDS